MPHAAPCTATNLGRTVPPGAAARPREPVLPDRTDTGTHTRPLPAAARTAYHAPVTIRRHLLPLLLPLGTFAALAACGTSRQFAPRENVNGTGPTGWPAAVYPLAAPAAGEVRLWSDGAVRREIDGEQVSRLLLGFELENTGTVPLRLDVEQLHVRELRGAGQVLPELQPIQVQGSPAAEPGGVARVDLEFDPGDVTPRAIDSFQVRWEVSAGEARYAQVTPFLPWFPEPVYWDHPYWGWGWGWGHWHCW